MKERLFSEFMHMGETGQVLRAGVQIRFIYTQMSFIEHSTEHTPDGVNTYRCTVGLSNTVL